MNGCDGLRVRFRCIVIAVIAARKPEASTQNTPKSRRIDDASKLYACARRTTSGLQDAGVDVSGHTPRR